MDGESVLDFYTEKSQIERVRNLPNTRENQILLGIVLAGSESLSEVREAVSILEKIIRETGESDDSRTCVYYLALGNARLQNYDRSVSLLDALIHAEPANTQAKELQKIVKKRMNRDGLLGIGLLGGAAALVGGLVIAGFALKK